MKKLLSQMIEIQINQSSLNADLKKKLESIGVRVQNILKSHDEKMDSVDKKMLSKEGLERQYHTITAGTRKLLEALQDSASFSTVISDTEKSMERNFSPSNDTDRILRGFQESEIRALMYKELENGDSLTFEAKFGGLVRGGNRAVIEAVKNCPLPGMLPVSDADLKSGWDRLIEISNPSLTDKLRQFKEADSTVNGMVDTALSSLGDYALEDPIADIANAEPAAA